MDELIIAHVAQTNAAAYYQRAQRFAGFAAREEVIRCQELAARHSRLARIALGVER